MSTGVAQENAIRKASQQKKPEYQPIFKDTKKTEKDETARNKRDKEVP
jgi:hypothetical protein